METRRRFGPDFDYCKALIEAGVDGISSARRELGGRALTLPRKGVVWAPAAIGATVGAVSARLSGSRKASNIAIGGLVGSLVGFTVALAWASRGFAGSAARGSWRRVSAARDAHWLAAHPIDYA